MSDFENKLAALKNESSVVKTTSDDRKIRDEQEDYLKTKRITRNYLREKQIEAELEKHKNLDLRVIPDGYFEELDKQADEMRLAQTESLAFITPNLTKLVPLVFPNLITIGALAGKGKTTTAANIAYQLFKNKNRVLIISNEEITINVYSRISCLELGLDINKRASFTDEQHELLKKTNKEVGDYIRVVDTNYAGNPSLTSSIEGIRELLNSLSKQEKVFDCIILDYYQKVTIWKEDPAQPMHARLQELSLILDQYYKDVKAPIVVLVQLHPDKSDEVSFEERIKGGKSIFVPSTFVLELRRVKDEFASEWICHKHRWGNPEHKLRTLWEKGKFIDPSTMGGSDDSEEKSVSDFLNLLFDKEDNVCICSTVQDKGTIVPMKALGNQSGEFFVINPVENGRNDKDVTSFRNIFIEFDNMSIDEQFLHLKSLGMPYSTLLFSGNKSFHYILSLEEPISKRDLYDFIVNWIHNVISSYDPKKRADPSTKSPSKLSRFPNVIRDSTKKRQKLIFVKERIKNDVLLEWLQRFPSCKPVSKKPVSTAIVASAIKSGTRAQMIAVVDWYVQTYLGQSFNEHRTYVRCPLCAEEGQDVEGRDNMCITGSNKLFHCFANPDEHNKLLAKKLYALKRESEAK